MSFGRENDVGNFGENVKAIKPLRRDSSYQQTRTALTIPGQ